MAANESATGQVIMDIEATGLSGGGQGFLRSTVIVTIGSLLNLAVGFVLQIVLAATFGTQMEMDAYWAAVSIPTLMNTVLIGSLNVAFVPVFVEYETQARQDHISTDQVWRVASGFVNLTAIVLVLLSSLCFLGAPFLVRLATPGFEPNSDVFLLTVQLTRILFPSLMFSGLTGVLSSLHYATRRFAAPSLIPVISSAFMLGATVLLAGQIGIASVAVGTLIGAVAQFLIVLPILIKDSRYHLVLDLKHESVRRITSLMAPWILGAIVSKANPIIDRFVASNLQEGSISYLGYAYKLLQISTMLVSKGIAIVLFPALSQTAAEQDWKSLKERVIWGMSLISLLVWPILIATIFLREPMIELLYERGRFDHEATIATGKTWLAYLGAFWATSIGSVVAYSFYAKQDTKTVMKVGVVGAVLNAILALALSKPLGYVGPALAYSIVAVFNFLILTYILLKTDEQMPFPHLGKGGRTILAALTTAGGLWVVKSCLDAFWQPTSQVQLAIYVVFLGTSLLLLYGGLLFAFGVDEIYSLRKALMRTLEGSA